MGFLFSAFLWVCLGFLYTNALEWVIHKHVLHGMGKKKSSFWSFHWSGHHRESRKNNFKDSRWDNTPVLKDREFLGVIFLTVLHVPTIWMSPVLYLTIVWRAIAYYRVHKKSHESEEWAKQNVPWHWDHHMGPRKAVEANWCVSNPFFDNLMGTRVKYYLTTEYFLDELKRKDKNEYKRMLKKLERVPNGADDSDSILDHVHAEGESQGDESCHR